MTGTPIPLTEVLLALSVHEGQVIMRALRLGATLRCCRQAGPDGPRYVLHAAVGSMTVTTGEHRSLGAALVSDLAARLEPHLRQFTA